MMGMENTPTFEAVVPILSVNDLGGALKYYEEVLGFQLGWTWGTPPELASVGRDKVELNLGQRGKAGTGVLLSPPRLGRVPSGLLRKGYAAPIYTPFDLSSNRYALGYVFAVGQSGMPRMEMRLCEGTMREVQGIGTQRRCDDGGIRWTRLDRDSETKPRSRAACSGR